MIKELLNPGQYRPLPHEAMNLCCRFDAPPRLVAHLTLVHDTAASLLVRLVHAYPALQVDSGVILFGAAIHDIGKAVHREELSNPGKLHETRGVELLTEAGIPSQQARFGWTHGNWNEGDVIALEDLLVALADNCWKGKRVTELEDVIEEQLSTQTGEPQWSTYSALDEILQDLAANADARLEQFPSSCALCSSVKGGIFLMKMPLDVPASVYGNSGTAVAWQKSFPVD